MKVAVAVIADKQQRILITKRCAEVTQGDVWEFPGGKLEGDESPADALIRETKEEVGLDILRFELISEIQERLPNTMLTLFFYLVTEYEGEASLCESQQDLRWVTSSELTQYNFPKANQPIIKWIEQKLQSPVT